MNRISRLFKRAKLILRTEGLTQLVRRGAFFLAERIVRHEKYYLYEFATGIVEGLNEIGSIPKIDNFTLKIVSSNEEADRLEAEGLEFRSQSVNNSKALEKRAVAFCIFVEQELAHTFWVGMTEEAKRSLNEPPYKVDFSKGEAFTGGAWTSPKYRRVGLAQYVGFQARQFLWRSGKGLVRGTVPKVNIASQQSYARLGRRYYAEARYLKILWWKSWKEKPLLCVTQ